MRWLIGLTFYTVVWILVASLCYFIGVDLINAVQSMSAPIRSLLGQHDIAANVFWFLVVGPASLTPIVAVVGIVHLLNLNAWDVRRYSQSSKDRTMHSVRIGFYAGLSQLLASVLYAILTRHWEIVLFSLAGLIAYPVSGYTVGCLWVDTGSASFRDW